MNLFEIYYKDKWEFKNLKLTLSRIDGALAQSGFSETGLGGVIHIAGTNGKGSVSLFLAQMLESVGFKTTLFTSPHIMKANERMAVSLKDITDEEFDRFFSEYENIIKINRLSYFEGLFFIAAMWFSENCPDFTILETGLGGRFDATNSSAINKKLCVLTSISQDHADILGHNIYRIIDEKLGVLRPSSTLILGINKDFIKKYIRSKIQNAIIETSFSPENDAGYPFPYSENYAAAKEAAKFITGKNLEDFRGLRLPPCRLEILGDLVLDGSHNPAGVMALAKSEAVKDISAAVFTVTTDRDPQRILKILKKICDNIILTSLPGNPRSVKDGSGLDCPFIRKPEEALAAARKTGSKILITGSFYLCAYMKKILADQGK